MTAETAFTNFSIKYLNCFQILNNTYGLMSHEFKFGFTQSVQRKNTQPLLRCTSSGYICIYTVALKVNFKKMKEIYHKKVLSENQIRGKMLLQSMYSLLIRMQLADFPWNVLLPVCYSREEYIKQLRASSCCQTAIEMLHALRRTVANPGIDALFEIGWTIKQPWKQSSCWDQTRAQLNLGG